MMQGCKAWNVISLCESPAVARCCSEKINDVGDPCLFRTMHLIEVHSSEQEQDNIKISLLEAFQDM